MENEIKILQDEIRNLKKAIRWLTNEVANNNCWIGKLSGEIDLSDFESNKESYENKLDEIIGEEE